ncbi:MAG: AAA family ATPase [Caldilineaceae bacterium]|nr:AAA family ATPase [Caldilineaceae bacterium]
MTLQIQLFGEFRLAQDDVPITAFNTPKLQLLLAYLLLHRAAPQARQGLAYRFWPDSNDAQARTNLRNALHLLRTTLPESESYLRIDHQTVQWRPESDFTVDVAFLEESLQAALAFQRGQSVTQTPLGQPSPDRVTIQQQLQQAIECYHGELLSSFYEDWVLAEREAWQARYLTALELASTFAEQQRDYRSAIDYSRRLLQVDPLREESYARLMQLYALQGDRATALRVYHNCATSLVRELGVEPGPVTQGIYERLLNLEEAQPAIAPLRAAAPLVGRQRAWEVLQAAWQQCQNGTAQFCLLSGEAGIGKTRLAEEFVDWAARQGIATGVAHCYAMGGRLALAPVQAWLRAPVFQKGRQGVDALWQKEATRLLPELWPEPNEPPQSATLTERWQRQQLFAALVELTVHGQTALLLCLDDIQWCDEESLDWLHYLLHAERSPHLLVVATARQAEIQHKAALLTFLTQLRRAGRLIEHHLERLTPAETATLVASLLGQTPAEAERSELYSETEGNPLFIVEMVRATRGDTGIKRAQSPIQPTMLGGLSLPPKVQAVIEARLAQLSDSALDLARVAAVIGRAFDAAVLAQASERHEDQLVQGLDELWQQGIIREQGFNRLGVEAYDFSHEKIREVVYHSLSSLRRRLLHRRVAEAMESLHVTTAGVDLPYTAPAQASALDESSQQVALHYERAGGIAKAIAYYQRAARVAHRRAAVHDALTFLRHAETLVGRLPAGKERTELTLALQIELGPLLLATKGYAAAEVEQAFRAAWQHCQAVGDAQQRFQVLWGLGKFYQVKPDLRQGTAVAKELLALAQVEENPEWLLEAYSIAGTHFFHNVALRDAKQFLDQSVALYDRQQHAHHALVYGQDPAIVGLTYGAWVRWCMGYPDQARRQAEEALAQTATLDHPYSRTLAMSYLTVQYQFMGDVEGCRQQAAATMAYTRTYGFTLWLASATFLHGWAVATQGDFMAGMAQMQEGMDLYRATGAELGAAYFAGLLAERLSVAGQPEISVAVMGEAFAILERTQDRWCEAELYRLKGELLYRLNDPALWTLLGQTPTDCYQQALRVARQQGARWWELRALVSFCQSPSPDIAPAPLYQQLAACYATFSEGHALPLLQTAQTLLTSPSVV